MLRARATFTATCTTTATATATATTTIVVIIIIIIIKLNRGWIGLTSIHRSSGYLPGELNLPRLSPFPAREHDFSYKYGSRIPLAYTCPFVGMFDWT